MLDQIHSGKLHNLTDFLLIIPFVALGLAFFAHRFGIMRTFQPHGQAIGEKPGAIGTERDPLAIDLFEIIQLEGKWTSFTIVILSTKDFDKFHQCLHVCLLFIRDLFHCHLPLLPSLLFL